MDKIELRTARKQCKCSKCGAEINPKDKYYFAEINFGPRFIRCTVRCTKCGLKSYEVTTSEYQSAVGALCEDWEEHIGEVSEGGVSTLIDEINGILSNEEEKFNNLPESLQYAPVGERIQERIDACKSAISALEDIDFDTLKSDAVDEVLGEDPAEYDEVLEDSKYEDIVDWVVDCYESELRDKINDALSNLGYSR